MGFQKSISYKNPRHGAPGPIGTSKSMYFNSSKYNPVNKLNILPETQNHANQVEDSIIAPLHQQSVKQESTLVANNMPAPDVNNSCSI